MKKIFQTILFAAVSALFVACGSDDYYHDYYPGHPWGGGHSGGQGDGGEQDEQPSGALNDYEKQIVGSYVSTSGGSITYYLTLNNDRTGSYTEAQGVQTNTTTISSWGATSTNITLNFSDGTQDIYEYSRSGEGIVVNGVAMKFYTGQDSSPLIGQWQASNTYYKDVWGLNNDSCMTVIEFASDGTGAQLDYDLYSINENSSYSAFTWEQSDTGINITYVEGAALVSAAITSPALTSGYLSGKMSLA